MPVLASLAAFIDAAGTIADRPALDAALDALGSLIDCPAWLLTVPDAAGLERSIGMPDEPWLMALAPAVRRVAHLACRSARRGFAWRDLPRSARPSRRDRLLLYQAHRRGLRSAITIPLCGRGARRGYATFATQQVRDFAPGERAALALLLPALEEAAWRLIGPSAQGQVKLTPRQRECLIWAARGKTDWEIARILGVGEHAIDRHLRQARDRYGVDKRSTLIVRALFDGTVSFEEALGLA